VKNKALSKSSIALFQKSLLEFYSQSKETKPWKTDKDPYKIWVFEVVMQQTRMEQGLPYFERLIAKFPTIEDLAKTKEDDLFAVWKGLGYYSRARNLQFTAKYIVNELGGKFPNSYLELLRLKGVGEYTAAAIASFAFDEDVAVLDGNVHRILSRIFGIEKTIQSATDKRYFQDLANQLLLLGKSAILNQAMMDMGSKVCKPINPVCLDCSFSHSCQAYQRDKVADFPPKKIRTELKKRFFHCLFIEYKGKIYLEKRLENDIWKGLYQGIVQEGIELDHKFWAEKDIDLSKVIWSETQSQTLSHQKIFMKMGKLKVAKTKLDKLNFFELEDSKTIAVPRIVSRWWDSASNCKSKVLK
jgi:A/G-specific adenine glycosylase